MKTEQKLYILFFTLTLLLVSVGQSFCQAKTEKPTFSKYTFDLPPVNQDQTAPPSLHSLPTSFPLTALGLVFFMYFSSKNSKETLLTKTDTSTANQTNKELQQTTDQLIWLQQNIDLINKILKEEKSLKVACQKITITLTERLKTIENTIYVYAPELKQITPISSHPSVSQPKSFSLNDDNPVCKAAKSKEEIQLNTTNTDKRQTIIPLTTNKELKGILVFSTLTPFTTAESQLLYYIAENLAITITHHTYRQKIQQLYYDARLQNEKLRIREEELKRASDELLEINTRLEIQQNQLEKKSADLKEKIKALNNKNTDLKTVKNKLEQKAKELELINKNKSAFLANITHELRTPLNSILLLSKLLYDNPIQNLNTEQINYAQSIHHSGNSMLQLVNEILDLSKVESGNMTIMPEKVKLKEVSQELEDSFAPIANQSGVRFKIVRSEKLPLSISTDRERLAQVLKNLLSNAFKFTNQGEVQLTISSPTTQTPETSFPNQDHIIFEVRDTGVGIEAGELPHIFDPFYQSSTSHQINKEGTGLGLSIAKKITKLLDGELVASSIEGKGSCFTLYLPTTYFKKTTNQNPNSTAKHRTSGNTPLLTDDRKTIKPTDRTLLLIVNEKKLTTMLMSAAHREGYKVILSSSGTSAVEYTRLYQPVAIVLDTELPITSCWSVLANLKEYEDTMKVPVFMLSNEKETRQKSITKGATGHSMKPLSPQKVGRLMAKIKDQSTNKTKNILLVENNEGHQLALKAFISSSERQCFSAYSTKESLDILRKQKIDCMILDMALPDESAYTLLEKLNAKRKLSKLPIIAYTGKNLSYAEETKLSRYAKNTIIKTADNYEDLMNEVNVFMGEIEAWEKREETSTDQSLATETPPLQDKKVLIVDDDIRNIFSLTKTLEGHGMEVFSANDGNEALEFVSSAHSLVDIILMDILMPFKDGYTTIKNIHKIPQWVDVPIIAVTAKTMPSEKKKCISAGAKDFLTKPIDSPKLISCIKKWVSEENNKNT